MNLLSVDKLRNVSSLLLVWGPALILVALPLVFNPFAAEVFEAPKVVVFRWCVGFLTATFLLARIRSESSASRLDVAVGLYGLLSIVATLHSINPSSSFWGAIDRHGTLTLLCLLAYYFVVSRTVRNTQDASRLVRAVVLGSVPVSLYGLIQFARLDPLSWISDSVSPVLSTMGRSNYLGAFLAMVVPLTLSRSLALRGRRGEWSIWLLLGVQIALVALSQARAAWLGLVAGLLVFAVLAMPRKRRRRALIAIGLVGVAVFVVLSWVNLSPNDFGGGSFAAARAQTVQFRLATWRCTLPIVGEKWLLGHGPETFELVFSERCPTISPGMIVDDPHNLVLAELVAGGILVAGALVGVIVVFFSQALRASDRLGHRLTAALYGSGTAYLVQAQFNPDVIVATVLFWTVLALVQSS